MDAMRATSMICCLGSSLVVGACDLYDSPWSLTGAEDGGDTEGDPDRTFFISEVTSYSTSPNNNCRATDVAVVTEDFKTKLQVDHWSGQRRSTFETRPSDFYDQGFIPHGKDHLYADSKRVAVFAGHGNVGIHGFRLEDPEQPGLCRGETPAYMGGQGHGDQQALFINVASCGGAFSEAPKDPWQCFRVNWGMSDFRQWLGFADSPVVDPTGLSTFYDSLPANYDSVTGQVDVWLEVMEFPESGAPTMPVTYTLETIEESMGFHGETVQDQMNMRSGKYMDDNPSGKQKVIMSPMIPLDGVVNSCTGVPC